MYLNNLVENAFEISKRQMTDLVKEVHDQEMKDVEDGIEYCRPLAMKW